jgi:membrane fusion protein (multidrug efflux system)
MRNDLIRTGLFGLLLAGLAIGLAGCTGKGEATESSPEAETEKAKKDEELVPVEVAALARGPIEAVLRYSANLEAESEVQVYSQAARLVTELLVEEGDAVAKGDVLLRLQDEEQRSELRRVESQLAKARREYERQENLYAQELISEQAMNDATYETDQLEIAFGDARRELGYTEVRAPIAGVVTRRMVNLGDTITVNQHLFDLVDFDTIVARVYVPERELRRLALGQTARIYSASLGGEARRGSVMRMAPTVDPQSGTVKVTVDVPRQPGLVPGMYVEVELVTETRDDALLVPKRAVVYDQNRAFLFRLQDDMTVERLPIEPAVEDRDRIQPAPGSTLEEGDRIVIAGQAGLKDGAKVRLAGQKKS